MTIYHNKLRHQAIISVSLYLTLYTTVTLCEYYGVSADLDAHQMFLISIS